MFVMAVDVEETKEEESRLLRINVTPHGNFYIFKMSVTCGGAARASGENHPWPLAVS